MAWALLPRSALMEPDPGQIIRSLRMALEMSQAEFARAAGWSPSTISSWERGRAKPSRLAFKTILAFAEERGVRYRPRSTSTALALAQAPRGATDPLASADSSAFAARRRDTIHGNGSPSPTGPSPALRPLLYSDRPAEPLRPAAEPPRWSAEASFRLTLGTRPAVVRSRLPRGLAEVAIAGLAFCAAWTLRQPLHHWLRPSPSTVAAAPLHAPLAAGAVHLPSVTAVSAPFLPPLAPADAPPVDPPAEAPPHPLVTARLESVVTISGAARATFRTANDVVTVTSGEWLGSREVAGIADDGVTLRDRDGVERRIHVGQQITFD